MTAVNAGGQPGQRPLPDVHRITLIAANHRWTFAFTAADAGAMLKRVSELARDPEAPLSLMDARLICERIAEATRILPAASPLRPTS